MAKKRKPPPPLGDLAKAKELSSDPYWQLGLYVRDLIRDLRTNGKTSSADTTLVAFEALAALEKAARTPDYEPHRAIAALPVARWREDCVLVPRELLAVLTDAWQIYEASSIATFKDDSGEARRSTGKTLGEAFAVEGGGQGRDRAVFKLAKFRRQTAIRHSFIREYLLAGGGASIPEIEEVVADQFGVSSKTVHRACAAWYEDILERLEIVGAIGPQKGDSTS